MAADNLFNSLAVVTGSSRGGSGFFIAPNKVLTAKHIVEPSLMAETFSVRDSTGQAYSVTDVNLMPNTDAAILTLDGDSNVPVVTVHCSAPSVLETVFAVGFPENLTVPIISQQTVAALLIGNHDRYGGDRILTVGVLVKGMSGGPLYNLNGEAVGIASAEILENLGPGIIGGADINAYTLIRDVRPICGDS